MNESEGCQQYSSIEDNHDGDSRDAQEEAYLGPLTGVPGGPPGPLIIAGIVLAVDLGREYDAHNTEGKTAEERYQDGLDQPVFRPGQRRSAGLHLGCLHRGK